jgi:hypothetical protein
MLWAYCRSRGISYVNDLTKVDWKKRHDLTKGNGDGEKTFTNSVDDFKKFLKEACWTHNMGFYPKWAALRYLGMGYTRHWCVVDLYLTHKVVHNIPIKPSVRTGPRAKVHKFSIPSFISYSSLSQLPIYTTRKSKKTGNALPLDKK